MQHPAAANIPTGSILTVAGGLMAQAGDIDLTHAGWYVVTLGVLSGGYNWWKAWLDYRVRQSEMDEIRQELKDTKSALADSKALAEKTAAELVEARQRRHEKDGELQTTLGAIQVQVNDVTRGVNTNTPTLKAVAEKVGVPARVAEPVESIIDELPKSRD